MKELYQIRETFETHLTGIRLGRDGQHKALCPFHDDNKTKSFSFNDEGLWKCFGCDKGGGMKQFHLELGIAWNGTITLCDQSSKRMKKSDIKVSTHFM